MTQPIGIFASLVGIIAGGIGIHNSTKSYNPDALGTLIWSMVLVLSIIFLFISLYSLHSYNQSEKTNKLLQELIDLKTGNKSDDSQEPQDEGVNTADAFLNKMNK